MQYLDILKSAGLFQGIDSMALESILICIGAEEKSIQKGEILLLTGDKPQHVGIVLAGQIHIIREDYNGKRSLLGALAAGEIFAEALCCAGISESPVTVMANAGSKVMLLRFSRILNTCPNSCAFHTKLIENMLGLIANKNLQMQNRMEIIAIKSIRAKVLRYLESFLPEPEETIAIPFNREELADYLCVERSALSHELARMKKDGLIEYQKNKFILKNPMSAG